jgi:hypothetical protein
MKNIDFVTQQHTDMVVSSKKYHQLLAIAELSARQMINQGDYCNLAQSLISTDLQSLPDSTIEHLNKCINNFHQFVTVNNHLMILLSEVGIVTNDVKSEEVKEEIKPEIKKPTFTVIK